MDDDNQWYNNEWCLDNITLKNSGGDLMAGEYKVQYNGLRGNVKAYNQLSAEAQIKWVERNINCFCDACKTKLVDMYSVSFTQMPLSYFTPAHKENN